MSIVASPNPIPSGGAFTLQISVRNNGPDHAYGVRLIHQLDSNSAFDSSAPFPATRFKDTLTFDLGAISNGVTRLITLTLIAPVSGSVSNATFVTAAVPDLVANNDSAVSYVPVSVTRPRLGLTWNGSQVVLSWPSNSTGFVLEQTTALNLGWTVVTNQPVAVGSQSQVTLPIAPPKAFFRLHLQ